jgi:hypothetical protein
MTRDDIIRMADEADLWADQELQCIGEYHPDWHEVRDVRFAALVAAAEREACAKEAELMAPKAAIRRRNSFLESGHLSALQIENEATGAALVALRCAAAIRARGNA